MRAVAGRYPVFRGDYASSDPRVQRITVKVAETLHAAGVNFGILFDGEQNSGNDVRRVGEEGVFEMLASTTSTSSTPAISSAYDQSTPTA